LRTTAGSALILLAAGAFAAPAPAASLQAPGSIAAREVLAVTATGLAPGRWAVFLSKNDYTGRPCLARLARRTARPDETVFSGVVPSGLKCPAPPTAQPPGPPGPPTPPGAPKPVTPGGGYRLVVCVPAGDDCARVPVARRSTNVVRTGQRCENVAFTPASDHGAFGIRARNVTCAVAREVARGGEDGDLRYRRAGLSCRGIFDDAGLARTVYRCTRRGERVTFAVS
jgi:hypothetical protein